MEAASPGTGDGEGAPEVRASVRSRALLAGLAAIPAAAVLALAIATPIAGLVPDQGDVILYQRTADAVLGGQVPYWQVRISYPPAALIPMVVPAIVWPGGRPPLSAYKDLFGAWEAVLVVALALVVRRLAAAMDPGAPDGLRATRVRQVSIRLAVLLLLAVFPLTFRFDLYPAVLASAGLVAVLDDRPTAAGLGLALAMLAKIYPFVLVPVAGLRWLAPRRWGALVRFGVTLGVALGVVLAPFLLAGGTAIEGIVEHQADRGVQLESLGGSVSLVAAALGGPAVRVGQGFGSFNLNGSVPTLWLAVDPLLTIAAFGLVAGVAVRYARRELRMGATIAPVALIRLGTAAILTLLLTNKVFSVQYVIWLIPFAALLPWRPFVVAVAVVALSTALHPFLYDELVRLHPLPIALLVARNALLGGLFAWLLADLWRGMARPAGLEPTTFRSAT
jgi:hypothetical protein